LRELGEERATITRKNPHEPAPFSYRQPGPDRRANDPANPIGTAY
jgi:hypothetical protein